MSTPEQKQQWEISNLRRRVREQREQIKALEAKIEVITKERDIAESLLQRYGYRVRK